ncbi:hypothetical protein F2Q70_00001317 [Brassica cretica]|uniref:Uncharacterized protein n=1 Tax=Brassica cretica TaxID=69181 RepID=A0A8S9ILK5_BRACR|nr:hypothetical protein F2Q70_00001317 [Brassica cretica]
MTKLDRRNHQNRNICHQQQPSKPPYYSTATGFEHDEELRTKATVMEQEQEQEQEQKTT